MKSGFTKEEVGNMAHTVQNKIEQTKHNFHHLKPLSIYSRMISCNQETSVRRPRNYSNHFTNFKVEIVNNFAQKRELENSSCDDGYETPSKKFSFDCDVADILCLSPIGTNAAVEVSDNVRSCQNPISSTLQNKQKQERRDVQKKKWEELKENRNVKDEPEDKGYFSMSYTKLPTTTSSPLHRAGENEALKYGCHPESSSEQAILSGQQVSIMDSDLCFNVHMPLLDSVNSPLKCLGDGDDFSNIGPPIFESSLCRSDSVILNAGSEHTRDLSSKELHEASSEPIHEEEATVDTSYEAPLSIKTQLKSVVVAAKQTTSVKPGFPPVSDRNSRFAKLNPEESKCEGCASRPRSQRPAIFNGELDWEHEKQQYIHLVTRHMNDKGEAQDVMSELLNLMTHVADQTPVSDTQWQHPSDLTRRNHQRRFGITTPKLSLQEWQAKNRTTHKRFASVPRVFERSQLP